MSDELNIADSPISADGSFTETFADSPIAPEVKDLVGKKGFKNVADIAKAYINLESQYGRLTGGKDYVFIPKDDKPESWSQVWDKLGRPSKAEEYEFETDDKELGAVVNDFKKFAHSLGLTKKQFNDIVKFEIDRANMQNEAFKQAQLEELTAREKMVREKFKNDFDKKMTAAQKVAEKFGKKEYFEKHGLDKDAEMLEFLNNIYDSMTEDTLISEKGRRTSSPEEEIKNIMASEAFRIATHPEHEAVYRRFLELHGVK